MFFSRISFKLAVMIGLSLAGMVIMAPIALYTMRAQMSGRIINISSVNAQKGQFSQANYAASKAGIYGFTKSLAQELMSKNITVNIALEHEQLYFKIQDDGKGINIENPFGNGLRNIKKRMAEIKGEVTFTFNNGTLIILEVLLGDTILKKMA